MAACAAAAVLGMAVSGCSRGRDGPSERFGGPVARRGASPELKVAITDPGSLDPAKIRTGAAALVVKQLCDSLVGFDPRTGALKPGLARSWTVSPDARKVTFQLRPGIRFHNGRQMVAEDIRYSLSRMASPQTASPQNYLLEKVAGYTEVRTGKSPLLSGVKALNPQTLEISLSEPYAEFPAVMSNPAAGSPVPREEVERSPEQFGSKPVCTGPYRMQVPLGATSIRLVRFPGYRGSNGAFLNKGRGYAGKITFRIAADQAKAYSLLRSGRVDVSPVPPADLAAARRIKNRVSGGDNGYVSYIGLPIKKPPFDNLDVRRALAYSIDRDAIVNGLLGGSRRIPAGFLPASAGPDSAAGACSDVSNPRSKPAAARAAQAKAGAAFPKMLNVYLNRGGGHERWLQTVMNQWNRQLGVSGSLKSSDWKPYVDLLTDPGADGPFRLGWSVRYPSAEALLAPLFSSASLDNFTRYSSPEFDGLMARARATVDDAERTRVYAQAGQVLCRDLPIIPVWFGRSYVAFGSGIRAAGSRRLDVFGDPVLRELKSAR